MKAHEASAWHKMAKTKVEAEKQSQAEGSVILQLKQGKERCNEEMKQKNCTDQEVVEDCVLFM